MIDQLVAEPFDVHGVAAGEVLDSLFELGGTLEVRAADVDPAIVLAADGVSNQLGAALRALFRENEPAEPCLALVLFNPDDVGDNLAGLFFNYKISFANVFSISSKL